MYRQGLLQKTYTIMLQTAVPLFTHLFRKFGIAFFLITGSHLEVVGSSNHLLTRPYRTQSNFVDVHNPVTPKPNCEFINTLCR